MYLEAMPLTKQNCFFSTHNLKDKLGRFFSADPPRKLSEVGGIAFLALSTKLFIQFCYQALLSPRLKYLNETQTADTSTAGVFDVGS